MNRKNIKFYLVLLFTLCTGLILIYSTYAWFSSTLNVLITSFNISTESHDELLLSLDGITWSDRVSISKEILIDILPQTYPTHRSQWSDSLFTISTVGSSDSDSDLFNLFRLSNPYVKEVSFDNKDRFIIESIYEDDVHDDAQFIAFDLFLKNTTPSPFPDNLFLNSNTGVISLDDDNMASNSSRIGFLFYDKIPNNSGIDEIQNISCNGKCKSLIFEPNSTKHTDDSIEDSSKHGIVLNNGYTYPTYGVINEGRGIPIWSGVYKSNVSIDSSHFDYQDTLTSFNSILYNLGDEITKVRVYVWIEGQDIDCLERFSDGYSLSVELGFRKEFSK